MEEEGEMISFTKLTTAILITCMHVCEAEGGRRRITGLILVIRAPSICLSMQVFSHALFVADSIIAFLFFIKGPLFFK